MFRFAFYGTGFDFLQTVMKSGTHEYTFLLLLYVIASAIILLNVLIGIFGNAFSIPAEAVEEEIEGKERKEEKSAGLIANEAEESTNVDHNHVQMMQYNLNKSFVPAASNSNYEILEAIPSVLLFDNDILYSCDFQNMSAIGIVQSPPWSQYRYLQIVTFNRLSSRQCLAH
jgi:hypothetical protein